ncbi:MAG: anthranilate phosphoribosyltransferase [Chromatiales bacterium]|nr:anthranilate phosphoribosyltransferase [Chromatiales bacterium]
MSTSTETKELQTVMHSIIQRIATGPELSKDISQEEARIGMQAVLEGAVDPVQAAIFFIALRMKRETDDENKGILDAILASTESITADVDEVVYLVDPYNGYNRSLPPSPFLPAVLAECEVPTISHGVATVGPKYGITHSTVLKALDINVTASTQQANERLADPAVGWSYLDQSILNPKLHGLLDLRKKMVKRQVITTTEVLVRPISGRSKTHLVTGYVHKPYPPKYAALAKHAGFNSNLLIRGVEGGVIPSLRQAGKSFFYYDMGELQELDSNPAEIGIEQSVRITPLPEELPGISTPGDEIALAVDVEKSSQRAAEAGVAALEGEKGSTYDALVYSGALILLHVGKAGSLAEGAEQVRAVLDSGKAKARLC